MLGWLGQELVSCTPLQTLWAGYGQIVFVTARSSSSRDTSRYVLKLISPPPGNDEGHVRKLLSYEVEQAFYATVAPTLDVPVAHCLASTHGMEGRPGADQLQGVTAMLLSDLRPDYPVAGGKRGVLSETAVHAALDWLARFHGASRGAVGRHELGGYLLPPLEEARRRERGPGGSKLWLNGGYTYLATRRGELADLADSDSEWNAAFCARDDALGCSVADAVAAVLTPSGRAAESVIHGDVKSENLFTTRKGDAVAFFDFQYVGLGLGVCDLAKLFTCSVPEDMLANDVPHALGMQAGEQVLLERYRDEVLRAQRAGKAGREAEYAWSEMVRHWETALVDWCRFQASWGFWGNTEWLEARVRHILADAGWRKWLMEELRACK
ncbi:uncharacterized protein COLE_06591 [Cutaneotrichosporon oleaginosum]|nr:hypothetical protein COLE_06591 [Cutaneotrichosporon oleaginosum]